MVSTPYFGKGYELVNLWQTCQTLPIPCKIYRFPSLFGLKP
jgi:hypothetical protein